MKRDTLLELLDAAPDGPAVTILLPTHRRFPEKRQDPVRYRNLVAGAGTLLKARHTERPHDALLEALTALEADVDFWQQGTEGLAVFADASRVRTVRLPRAVPEAVHVDRVFRVRPLLRLAPSGCRFQVLCLTRRAVRLLEGDAETIAAVELAPSVPRTLEASIATAEGTAPVADATPAPPVGSGAGQRGRGGTRTGPIDHRHGAATDAVDPDVEIFFRQVDRGVQEFHSRPSGLPLLVVGVADNLGPFRALSRNPRRFDPGIEADPAGLGDAEIRARACRLIEQRDAAGVDALLERFGSARASGLATDDLAEARAAADEGRVDTLLVEAPSPAAVGASVANRADPGVPDGGARGVPAPASDEPLDVLAEAVLRTGGELVVVPCERLAAHRDRFAAILRYRA